MSEYIITDKQAKEIVNQLPTYYVPTWLYLWVHTEYPYEPPNDWVQVREKHIGVNLPEIVRCRDCKEYVEFKDYATCGYFGGDYAEIEPDGFCAWGERNDGKAAEKAVTASAVFTGDGKAAL